MDAHPSVGVNPAGPATHEPFSTWRSQPAAPHLCARSPLWVELEPGRPGARTDKLCCFPGGEGVVPGRRGTVFSSASRMRYSTAVAMHPRRPEPSPATCARRADTTSGSRHGARRTGRTLTDEVPDCFVPLVTNGQVSGAASTRTPTCVTNCRTQVPQADCGD
jgi:hypothetical protein